MPSGKIAAVVLAAAVPTLSAMLLGIAGTAPASTAPAGTGPTRAGTAATTVRPGDPRLHFMGHWGHTAGAAITVNSGSELTFRFTGHTLTGLFDTSTIE